MSISIIAANTNSQVAIGYSFVSHLNRFDQLLPQISLNLYHFSEGSAASKPVLVSIHGGGWYQGDKIRFDSHKPRFFNDLGMLYVSLNYRLARPPLTNNSPYNNSYDPNRVRFPTLVEDCANALKWITDNISDYGGDPNNIVLFGHSAGAHLALLLSTNTSYINAAGVNVSQIKSCISVDTSFFNIKDIVDNKSTADSTEGGNSALLCENAFGIEYKASRIINDFSSVAEETAAYNAGSPDEHISSGIVPSFLVCIQGNPTRRQKCRDFISSLSTVGIGTSICIYLDTYDHEEMQSHIGNPLTIPVGNSLPTAAQIEQGAADVDISSFISRYLTQIGII